MTMMRDARRYIDEYGIDKAKRLVSSIVYHAEFYSEKTGSYYAFKQKDVISLKHLKKAIFEYELLILMEEAYTKRLNEWRK